MQKLVKGYEVFDGTMSSMACQGRRLNGQGFFIVTLSGSEESSPDALREMLRFAQHDRLSEKNDFEKALLNRGLLVTSTTG